ncbi:transposase [Paracoccus sp. MC1862]|uniref:REP-associated tyrosine transposase n=1 Tax=Paracoccus sp. MC1862 TaxID=2760307 RepID=UPI0016006C1A|nr:transposase [Paracoccus sp. MC1862]MBB1499422.1 transposase [Paracoccus sp. MC1862]QQO45379.1 transposase [Paracoccus sp. MC1862]
MPRYLRPRLPGVPIFFTVALAQRGSSLLLEEVEQLRQAVRVTRAERPFAIEAWVVLPDHLHCIWRLPEGDTDYPARWRLIKARFSRAVPMGTRRDSHIARRERGVWQRRFWDHHIRDEADLAAHLRYCWFNPVKHGLVQRVEDWPFSSVHREIGGPRWEWAMQDEAP